MGRKKKVVTDYNRIIVFADGARYPIERSDGKYHYCGNTQFRIARNDYAIEEIEKPREPSSDVIAEIPSGDVLEAEVDENAD